MSPSKLGHPRSLGPPTGQFPRHSGTPLQFGTAHGPISPPFRDNPRVWDRPRASFPAAPGHPSSLGPPTGQFPCHSGTPLPFWDFSAQRHGRIVPPREGCPISAEMSQNGTARTEANPAQADNRVQVTVGRTARVRTNNQRARKTVRVRPTDGTDRRSGAARTVNMSGERSGLGGFNTSCEPCEHGSFVAAVPDRPPGARRAPPKPPETASPRT